MNPKYNIGNEIWFWYLGEVTHGIIHEVLGEKYNAIWYGVTLLDGITKCIIAEQHCWPTQEEMLKTL